jgi:hypothetical protein
VAPPKASASLRALGRQLLLILGAVEVLDSGWADNNAGTTSRPLPTPSCWVVKLDWASSYALFHSHELWVEALTVESPEDFSLLAAGCKVGLVSDRSSGTDKDRGLHWEITILDPLIDDIVQEMELRDGNSQSKLTIELSGALLERFATRTDLGLEPFEASEGGVSGSHSAFSSPAKPTPGKLVSPYKYSSRPPCLSSPAKLISNATPSVTSQTPRQASIIEVGPETNAPQPLNEAAVAEEPVLVEAAEEEQEMEVAASASSEIDMSDSEGCRTGATPTRDSTSSGSQCYQGVVRCFPFLA